MSSPAPGEDAPPPSGPSPGSEQPGWAPRVDWLLAWIEFGFVIAFAIYAAVGMLRYVWHTGGTLDGLLTLLDSKWKGVLILAAIVFFRTLNPLVRGAKLKAAGIEVTLPTATVLPPNSYLSPPLANDTQLKPSNPGAPKVEQ